MAANGTIARIRRTQDLPAVAALTLASLLVLACQLNILLAKYRNGEDVVASDGKFYYVYLPSLLLDRDLDFSNDYELIGARRQWEREAGVVAEGYVSNVFTVGPALLWAPFFCAGHGATVLLNRLGAQLPENGYGPIDMGAVVMGNCIYGCAGLFLLYFALRRKFTPFTSVVSVLCLAFCTSMLFFLGDRASYPPPTQFFVISLLLSRCIFRDAEEVLASPATLGVALGLVVLVKATDGLVAVVPALVVVPSFLQGASRLDRKTLGRIALVILVAAAVNAPKIYVKQTIHPGGDPRLLSGYLHPAQPFFLEQLFSTRRGLLTWAPALWLAIPGLCILWKKHRRVTIGLIVASILLIYVNGIAADWWGGRSPGTRRLVNLLPLLAAPMASCVEWMAKTRRVWTAALFLLLGFDNLLLYQVFLGDAGFRRRTVSFVEVTTRKARLLCDTIGTPTAFPASLYISARYGIPPPQAELIWGVYLDTDFEKLDFGADARHYLGRGWIQQEGHEERVTFRETAGASATLLVGRLADGVQMRRLTQLTVRARSSAEANIDISLNGHPLRPSIFPRLSPQWSDLTFDLDPAWWRPGINECELELSGKGRRLSLSVDEIGFGSGQGNARPAHP